MLKFNEIVQWIGTICIILGHALSAIGPQTYPFNVLAFSIGSLAYLAWSIRVTNRPQLVVNSVALTIGIFGIIKAIL